ncbi:MAG: hypothetical protein LBD06_05860 [Candidatus Accumulibacter sp.]|nr:hypothetical protein [Accumulibacter sp.]
MNLGASRRVMNGKPSARGQRTEDRRQKTDEFGRFAPSDERKTKRSVFRFLRRSSAANLSVFCLLSSALCLLSSILCPLYP